jgi:endonuclease/exonuclease/phosphatase family metal-dependent hydrolase
MIQRLSIPFLFFLFLTISETLYSQNKQEKKFYSALVGFYNVENLYDTIDNPHTRDEEYLPAGVNEWNTAKYSTKLEHLSRVISEMGTDVNPDGLAMLGMAEIENREVVEDLINTPKLKNRNYQIVHYDSPDRRGVDVAFIYQPKYFTLTNSKSYRLVNPADTGFRTRDQLVVSGKLDGEPIHIIVAHWPSRRGGEKRSLPMRILAAELGLKIIDSLRTLDPNAKVMYMGDLNDDPVSPSVKKHLNASNNKNDTTSTTLYNPMYDLFKKGIGTLAWKDSWNLFDQIILTNNFIKKDYSTFRYHSTKVFNKPYLTQPDGNFKGYPFRTFSGGTYTAGYSDHFGVYLILVKEVD